MNPSTQSPLWDEIKRLRRDLTDLSDRHHNEFMRVAFELWIVYPGPDTYALDETITVLSIRQLRDIFS